MEETSPAAGVSGASGVTVTSKVLVLVSSVMVPSARHTCETRTVTAYSPGVSGALKTNRTTFPEKPALPDRAVYTKAPQPPSP